MGGQGAAQQRRRDGRLLVDRQMQRTTLVPSRLDLGKLDALNSIVQTRPQLPCYIVSSGSFATQERSKECLNRLSK